MHILKLNFRKVLISFIIIIILANASVLINKTTIEQTFSILYGISALGQAKEKVLFVVFIMMFQYFNSEIIIYHIHNYDYLLIRCATKKSYFKSMLSDLCKSIIMFWIISLISIILLSMIYQHKIIALDLLILIGSLFLCFCVGMIQTLLLIRYRADFAVFIMLVGSIVYAFLSQLVFTNLTASGNIASTLKCVSIVVLSIMVYFFLQKNFMKEWQTYAN